MKVENFFKLVYSVNPLMSYPNLAILDVETTGSSAPYDRIIEVGILRVEQNKIVKTLNTLINPEIPISPFITNLTGIADKDLDHAPTFYDIKNDLAEIMDDCIFVAHNARFDYSFLRHEFKRIGVSYQAKQLCTVKLSRLLFPELRRHNLDSIIERFEIECQKRHRAFDDAKVIWDFLQKLNGVVSDEKIQTAYKAILKKPSLPPLLLQKDIDELPETHGVYMFFGKSEIPLYIGKSVNIKDRVVSHFINDTENSRELEISQQVERIETVKTAGELGALILESELIKKLQPLYNRKLRYRRLLTTIVQEVDKNGTFKVSINTGEAIENKNLENILGIFKSQKQAKEHLHHLIKEHGLCQKSLGLQKIKGACFAYQLGWCKGICKGKENNALYNARFILAFSKTKLRAWPFKGPIVIKEENEELGEAMVFDKWCYLGKFSEFENEDLSDITTLSDFDVYKLLNSFLRNDGNMKKIFSIESAQKQNSSGPFLEFN